MVTSVVSFLGLVWLMFAPCSDPEIRMTKYIERVGSVYENIDYSKRANRSVPMFFIFKRVLFAVGCWYIKVELVSMF